MTAVYVWAVIGSAYLGVAALTATGQRRRSSSRAHVVMAGLAWPVAWAVWYVQDNRGAHDCNCAKGS